MGEHRAGLSDATEGPESATTPRAGGHFFQVDPGVIQAMRDAGGTFQHAAAYLILARFADNRGTSKGCTTNAGALAVQNYLCCGRPRATQLLSWLQQTADPRTGVPFVLSARASTALPRSRPMLSLNPACMDEELVALPNLLATVGRGQATPSSESTLHRLTTTPVVRCGKFVAPDAVRLAGLQLLIGLYAHLDVARVGGADLTAVACGEAAWEPEDGELGSINVELNGRLKGAALSSIAEGLHRPAYELLRSCGTIRHQVSVVQHGEVGYCVAALGDHVPPWSMRDTRSCSANIVRKAGGTPPTAPSWAAQRLTASMVDTPP
jgi:hypothetical protein